MRAGQRQSSVLIHPPKSQGTRNIGVLQTPDDSGQFPPQMSKLFLVFLFRQFRFPISRAFETRHGLLVKSLFESRSEFFTKILKDAQKYVAEFSFGPSLCHILSSAGTVWNCTS